MTNTTVVVLDIRQQAPDFVYDNGTFINEVAWSKDSTLVSFPEIEVPCDYIESCQEDEEEVIWRLTTLIHSGDNEWEVLSSRKLERVDETPYWEQHSICEGEWEVVRDDLPEGFTLVGWQILEQ